MRNSALMICYYEILILLGSEDEENVLEGLRWQPKWLVTEVWDLILLNGSNPYDVIG